MPTFQVELDDGRAFEVEADSPPSLEDVHSALGLKPGPIQKLNPTEGGDIDEANYKQMLGVSQAATQGPSWGQTFTDPSFGWNPGNWPGMFLQGVEKAAAALGNAPAYFARHDRSPEVLGKLLGVDPQVIRKQTDKFGLTAPSTEEVFGAEPQTQSIPYPYEAGVPTAPGLGFANEDIDPVNRELGNALRGFTTPGMMATLPFAATKPVQGLFLSQTIPATVESGVQAIQAPTADARNEALTRAALNAYFSAQLGRGMRGEGPLASAPGAPLKPSGPEFEPGPLAPPDYPLLTENVYQPATPIQPIGGAGFTVDAAGRVVRKADLTEAELRELARMQGSGEYVQREEQVRPAQATPPIVGEQPHIMMRRAAQIEEGGIRPAYQAAGEPKQGGQVSFEAPAAAGGVPSARQAAISPEAFGGVEQPPDVIAKVIDVVNNKDRLDLERRLAAFQAEPGAGVAGATRTDLIRVTEARLRELKTGGIDPELEHLRRTLKPKEVKPLPEGSVIDLGQKQLKGPQGLLSVGEAFERAQKEKRAEESILYRGQPSWKKGLQSEKREGIIWLSPDEVNAASYGETRAFISPSRVFDITQSSDKESVADFIFSVARKKNLGGLWKVDTTTMNPTLLRELIHKGDWPFFEDREIVRELKQRGYEGLKTVQGGKPQVGVFETPKQREWIKEEVKNAPNIRGNQGEVPEKGLPLETGEKARSDDLQQPTGGQGEPGGTELGQKPPQVEGEVGGEQGALSADPFQMLDPEFWQRLGLKSGDAQQFYNRIRNQLGEGSAAWEMVKDVLPKTGRVTQEEVRKAVEEKGQKVEVHVYGMEGKVSEARKDYDRMTHEWYDTLNQKQKQEVDRYRMNRWQPENERRADAPNLSDSDIQKATKYIELKDKTLDEPPDTSPRATSTYSYVSTFPTTEPMPEWTKTKGKSNVQRVDVVIPQEVVKTEKNKWGQDRPTYNTMWSPDSIHENLPNTLGWAMIQYKTGPNGEKMAVVAEAQSRWGKNLRESQKAKDKYQKLLQRQTELEQQLDAAKTPQESGRINDEIRALQAERPGYSEIPDHPLLRDYNRLILKAAIRQAKEEGATHIVVPDAETAMMTEGHDLVVARTRLNATNDAEASAARRALIAIDPELGNHGMRYENGVYYAIGDKGDRSIQQEPGMRLNYDPAYRIVDKKGNELAKETFTDEDSARAFAKNRTAGLGLREGTFDLVRGDLHSIAEELTGSKGEKVSLGEHKNAYEDLRSIAQGNLNTREASDALGKPRSNLIFRNPDGTPKTDVSGLSYPLDKTRETFSLTGKDKPLSTTANAPSAKGLGASIRNVPSGSEEGAISLQPLKDVWDKTARFVKAGANKERISQLIDAADNAARLFAREQGNRLRVGLKNKQDRIALWAVVEAGGDPKKLQTFLSQVAGTRYEQQVRYAIAHQARLQPYADALGKQMEGQRNRELASGINTDEVPDYIKHAYDLERPGVFWDTGKGGGGLSTSFKKQRTFDTYASAIEAGFKPKNLDAADLVESRIAAGMKMVNRVKWGEQLRALKDPTDKMPLVESMVKQPKGTMVAPRGYSPRELLPGVRIAIKDGYGDIFDTLTGGSDIQKHWAGRAALSTEGLIKHGLLLFDSFHASRMLQKELFMTGQARVKRAQSLLEYDQPTINRLVASGDLPPETGAWYTKNRPTYDKLVANGLNIGRIGDALYAQVIRKELKVMGIDVNLPGRFNKWVFDKVTRSAMTEVALSEFERAKSNNPKWTDDQTAAYVAKQTNVYFGNLMRQGIFKGATARDALQLAFLAPQWVEGLAQSELRAAKQVGQIPIDLVQGKALQVGSLAKGVGTGLLAYAVATQLINQFTRGKFTWQNPEKDHKLDAWIPDPTGKTPGWFLSPMSVAAEVAHDFVRYSFKGKDPVEVASQIIGNKASPLARSITTEFTGRDYSGTKILGGHFEREKQAGKALLPLMLPASGFTSEIPGQVGKQLMASGGLKVEQASAREEKAIQSSGMTLRERSRAEKKEVKPPTTLGQRFSIAQKSTEHNFERQQLLTDRLSKKSQAFLDQHALQLRGYEAEYSNEGTKTRLSAEEDDKMREFVAQRYDAAIDKLSRRGDWATANQKRKQVLLDAGLKAAREKSDRDYRNWYKSRFATPVQK